MIIQRVGSQCWKELVQIRRDRLTLALAFLLPLMTLLIFGFAIRLELKNIPLTVWDYDQSFLSRSYIERLYATNQFVRVDAQLDLSQKQSLNPGLALVDQGRAKATVIIPPDFASQLKARAVAPIQVLVDGTDVNNARVIENSIQATTDFFSRTLMANPPTPMISPRIRLWFNPGRREALNIVPGVFALVLAVFPALLMGVATVREKEKGTILQVYASQLSATEWLLGKLLAYVLLGMAMALFTISLGMGIFQLRLAGDPLPLLLGTPVYLCSTVGFGLMVGARNQEQNATVQAVALVMFLTSLLLSGFIYPLSNIPFPLSLISNVVPARYYILITRDAFVRGTGWPGVWFVFPILAAIALVEFTVARKSLQRMQVSD